MKNQYSALRHGEVALQILLLAFTAILPSPASAGKTRDGGPTSGAGSAPGDINLALVAKSSTSFVSGHETITALNDGFTPENSNDKSHGAYGNWPRHGTQWVQYEWTQPISTRGINVYWFDDDRGVRLPTACRLLYWDGTAFVPVPKAAGPGLEKDKFNRATFPEITTSKLSSSWIRTLTSPRASWNGVFTIPANLPTSLHP